MFSGCRSSSPSCLVLTACLVALREIHHCVFKTAPNFIPCDEIALYSLRTNIVTNTTESKSLSEAAQGRCNWRDVLLAKDDEVYDQGVEIVDVPT